MKKLISVLLSASMLVSYASIPLSASAEASDTDSDISVIEKSTDTQNAAAKLDLEKSGKTYEYSDYKYTILDDGTVEITGYNGNDSEITIPSEIDEMSVTSIGEFAFEGCDDLTSVIIGNSVTSIGTGAFSDCTGLTRVTIPDSVTSIGNDAFNLCTGLTSITIPNSVTSIGDSAFYCTSLTNVYYTGTEKE